MQQAVAGILLAAGQGSRLGRPKALVEVGGMALVSRGIALLSGGGADPVIVVSGAVPLHLDGLAGVTEVHNPDWRSGMGSSFRVGLASVPAGCDAAVIALADQPLIRAAAVQRLIAAFAAGAGVAVASYDGKLRNPVLLARRHWAAAAASATGDAGARSFLRVRPDLVTAVDCTGCGTPDDLDTTADLERIAALLEPPAGIG